MADGCSKWVVVGARHCIGHAEEAKIERKKSLLLDIAVEKQQVEHQDDSDDPSSYANRAAAHARRVGPTVPMAATAGTCAGGAYEAYASTAAVAAAFLARGSRKWRR